MRALALLAAAFVAGCAAPRFHDRQILVLTPASEAHFEVSYAESGDCLWRQRWPARYDVDRGPYRLALLPVARFADEPAEFRLELGGDGNPRAVVEGARADEAPLAEGLRRYRIRPPGTVGQMAIEIQRDGRRIGLEEISYRAEQCRALMWR
jgi:hypothetical protein